MTLEELRDELYIRMPIEQWVRTSTFDEDITKRELLTALLAAEKRGIERALKEAECALAMLGSNDWVQEAIEVVRYDGPLGRALAQGGE